MERPCERCGATEETSAYPPMCTEVELTHSLLTWLCYDCRKSWNKLMKCDLPLSKRYSRASLKLDHWKSIISSGKSVSDCVGLLPLGLDILDELDGIESEIYQMASAWLIE